MKVELERRPHPLLAAIFSLLFWTSLIVAATLYAVVALSPRLLTSLDLGREFYLNQVKLVSLEGEVEELERVRQALQNDPKFAAELARIELGVSTPGDEQILVEESLRLGAQKSRDKEIIAQLLPPWYALYLEQLTSEPRERRILLSIAAGLTLFAFTFLQGVPNFRFWPKFRLGPVRHLIDRYRKVELVEEEC